MIHCPERYTPSQPEYNKIPNLDHRRDIRPTPTALRERAPHIYAVQGRTKFAARRFSRTSRRGSTTSRSRYALTPEEAARLRRIVERCNTKIVAELRGQYERLAAIDCLKR